MKTALDTHFSRVLIAALVSGYLKFCYATTRWRTEGQAEVEAVWAEGGPVVLMFWHERLHLGHASWPIGRAQPVAVLTSLSKFGDVIAEINKHFAHHTIRGSSAKKSDPSKNKGGAQAFRDLLRWIRQGNCAATTPDGPRGPRRHMADGSLKLSQMCKAKLVCLGQSTNHYLRFNSWDHMRLPLPFGKGAMVWQVLPVVPADADEAEFERLRGEAETVLSAVTDRADVLVGLTPDPALS
ncbi:lysophospholipid acyltransferase family protein [Asticcacaulis sp. EMRT-3]|uniref:lysophospholipid acyltransferase family protein n=1 Tax=Asticcacaulis sp. EMRT-3 TaxID=3040349 RepID=UPI0024AF6BA3|nr:lysophospholipid acyltransferase family protein [Asticcacaulis sp. EMRT-3]MDI7774087.1 lysophospholipid acyltransferase family protein [Asticcacaulis sp. EMRT-3]